MSTNVASKWKVDPGHSKVQFKVRHLAIANVVGIFKVFNGDVESEQDDFSIAKINFEIDANSIDTNLEPRDTHLRSELFLDVSKFPKIIFNGAMRKKGDSYEVEGDLTIRDTTRPVKLEAEFNGTGKDSTPLKNTRAGFEASGKIHRKDFGITFSMVTEAGSLVVGEEIKLQFDIELIRQAN